MDLETAVICSVKLMTYVVTFIIGYVMGMEGR